MKRLQFSLSDLLWTVGLLAMTLTGIGIIVRIAMGRLPAPNPIWYGELMAMAVYQTPISLCAAVGAPFRRKRLGAWIGLAILTVGAIIAPFIFG